MFNKYIPRYWLSEWDKNHPTCRNIFRDYLLLWLCLLYIVKLNLKICLSIILRILSVSQCSHVITVDHIVVLILYWQHPITAVTFSTKLLLVPTDEHVAYVALIIDKTIKYCFLLLHVIVHHWEGTLIKRLICAQLYCLPSQHHVTN